MRHPSYLLNPGDLFQVEPDRVMFATGTPKTKLERREGRLAQRKQPEEAEEEATEADEVEEAESKDTPKEDTKKTLKTLLSQAKTIMSTDKTTLPAKRKQELRGFQKAVRRVLSRSESSTVLTDNLEAQFSQLTLLLNAKRSEKKPDEDIKKDEESKPEKSEKPAVADTTASDKLSEAFEQATLGNDVDASELDDEEFDILRRALTQMRDNPIDNTKPYATPWRPRDYMSAFAFIPRYLEVNQNICAAVYLRHPVARPGSAEVPTPFGESIATPAYGWYLKRRW
jgi:ribosomal protein S4